MINRYVPKSNRKTDCPQGRPVNPDTWKTGPDPLVREQYYAYLKHRSQAKYRNEDYSLTFEDWQAFWTNGNWDKRGRTADSLCLARLNNEGPWAWHNVAVLTRLEQLLIPRKR